MLVSDLEWRAKSEMARVLNHAFLVILGLVYYDYITVDTNTESNTEHHRETCPAAPRCLCYCNCPTLYGINFSLKNESEQQSNFTPPMCPFVVIQRPTLGKLIAITAKVNNAILLLKRRKLMPIVRLHSLWN